MARKRMSQKQLISRNDASLLDNAVAGYEIHYFVYQVAKLSFFREIIWKRNLGKEIIRNESSHAFARLIA